MTLASLEGEREGLELILVAEGGVGAAPDVDRTLEIWPAGAGYARNRGLALARAPRVAFLDAPAQVDRTWVQAAREGHEEVVIGPGGSTVFPREALMQVGGFDLSLGQIAGPGYDADAVARLGAAGTAVRRDPRLRGRRDANASRTFATGAALGRVARRQRSPSAAVRALAGAARGRSPAAAAGVLLGAIRPPSRSAPELSRDLIPPSLQAELGALELAARPLRSKAKTQFMYRAGTDSLLHVYLDPTPRLRRSLNEREEIRGRSVTTGIPRVLAAAEGLDSLWVLEELMPGRAPDPSEVSVWFPRVAEWIVALGAATGRPLRESEPWSADRAALVSKAPEHVRSAVEQAATAIESLPSTPMHGDLQRTNVLLSASGVAVVDWEGAWLEGIPGLDLVFLALLAADDGLDPEIAEALATGRDAPWGGLRAALSRVGVAEPLLPAGLLVMLASWSLAEERRRERLGAGPSAAVFRPLLEQLGPTLARQVA